MGCRARRVNGGRGQTGRPGVAGSFRLRYEDQSPPDVKGPSWIYLDKPGIKNPRFTGVNVRSWILLYVYLVEAAGVEPASVGTRLLALHA